MSFCSKYSEFFWKFQSNYTTALYSISVWYNSLSMRTRAIKLTLIHKWREDYMRLLGGILRPSLNHVIPGRGKLWICGGKINAASPCDTTWDRSPCTKPSMSKKQREREGAQIRTKQEQGHCDSLWQKTQGSNLVIWLFWQLTLKASFGVLFFCVFYRVECASLSKYTPLTVSVDRHVDATFFSNG